MLKRLCLIAAMATFALPLSEAQYFKTRQVTGVVTDLSSNPLPGSAVQLENSANLTVRSYITHKDGRYQFYGLDTNVDYTLKAKYRNHWSGQKTLDKFNSSTHPEINLVVPVD